MSFEKFTKGDVEYSIFYGTHITDSYPIIRAAGGLESIDALVIETGEYAKEPAHRFLSDAFAMYQYKEIFRQIPSRNPNLVLYGVDFPHTKNAFLASLGKLALTTFFPLYYGYFKLRKLERKRKNREKITRRELIKESLKGTGALLFGSSLSFGAVQGFSNSREIDILSSMCSWHSIITPDPVLGFRNSVAAKIVEDYIVPSERAKGNARIGILYGATHTGIEENIKYKSLRETTISAYRRYGYPGTTRDGLNKIRRYGYSGGYWSEEILLELF